MSKYPKFYQKTREERIKILESEGLYHAENDVYLDGETLNHMSENNISSIETPLGVVPEFPIDGRLRAVAMATEEPSVVAAANKAAGLFSQGEGFVTQSVSRVMKGQIIMAVHDSISEMMDQLRGHIDAFSAVAQEAHPSIYKRGGGVLDFNIQLVADEEAEFITLNVLFDTQQAMGANIINTILETIAEYIRTELGFDILMSILSNDGELCTVCILARLNISLLKGKEDTAKRIVASVKYATLDPQRAITHNKGILNGIEAVARATGNDTRAIAASICSYSARSGSVQPLTTWEIADDYLVGKIECPMPIGVVSASMKANPKVKLSMDLMNNPTAEELMALMAAVGLAQNFSALYALVSEGIQKGHMSMQANALALQVEATSEERRQLVQYLRETKNYTLENAKKYIQLLRK